MCCSSGGVSDRVITSMIDAKADQVQGLAQDYFRDKVDGRDTKVPKQMQRLEEKAVKLATAFPLATDKRHGVLCGIGSVLRENHISVPPSYEVLSEALRKTGSVEVPSYFRTEAPNLGRRQSNRDPGPLPKKKPLNNAEVFEHFKSVNGAFKLNLEMNLRRIAPHLFSEDRYLQILGVQSGYAFEAPAYHELFGNRFHFHGVDANKTPTFRDPRFSFAVCADMAFDAFDAPESGYDLAVCRHQNSFSGREEWHNMMTTALDALKDDGILYVTSYTAEENRCLRQMLERTGIKPEVWTPATAIPANLYLPIFSNDAFHDGFVLIVNKASLDD